MQTLPKMPIRSSFFFSHKPPKSILLLKPELKSNKDMLAAQQFHKNFVEIS
uniref:Uncharacterized protein n=1 Tax=Arundo donax TaxID=35708 RepID=A0A0A9DF42_ARUDO